jgi:hypothetical protein
MRRFREGAEPSPISTKGNDMDIFAWFTGKRTYIVAFVTAALGLAQAIWPDFAIPAWADYVLAGIGVTTMRAAITNSK